MGRGEVNFSEVKLYGTFWGVLCGARVMMKMKPRLSKIEENSSIATTSWEGGEKKIQRVKNNKVIYHLFLFSPGKQGTTFGVVYFFFSGVLAVGGPTVPVVPRNDDLFFLLFFFSLVCCLLGGNNEREVRQEILFSLIASNKLLLFITEASICTRLLFNLSKFVNKHGIVCERMGNEFQLW